MAAPGSPESDIGSFECFQNYTAPEVFVQGLAGQINQEDVEAIIRAQKQMLQRFEKTNEMLSNCNSLSYSRFSLAQKELKKHTTLLHDMKKDLDNIFKRIRNLKSKVSNQYPAAFADAQKQVIKENKDDSDEEGGATSCKENPKEAETSNECASMNHSKVVTNCEGSDEIAKIDKDVTNSSSCDSMSSAKLSSSSSFDN